MPVKSAGKILSKILIKDIGPRPPVLKSYPPA
jgi:hypothetical protein